MTETAEREALVRKMASAIATRNGDELSCVPENKRHWTRELGMFGGRVRDINEPFLSDYLEMADAALTVAEESRSRLDAERVAADTARLLWLSKDIDGIGDMDLHEQASIYASAFGREEANDDDRLAAVRDAIDRALSEQGHAPGAASKGAASTEIDPELAELLKLGDPKR